MTGLLEQDTKAPSKVTSATIRLALRERYPSASHSLFFEVANGTGANVRRRIDAVALGIWPSTGQELHGIEIKVSRSDWKRELANPQKAQELMRFASRWYLACPSGVVEASEVPDTWGLLTVSPEGRIREARKAPRLQPEPLTRDFMCAILRQAGAVDQATITAAVEKALSEERAKRDELVKRAIEQERLHRGRRQESIQKAVAKIEAITGKPVTDWSFDAEGFAKAVNLVQATGVTQTHGQVEYLAERVRSLAKGLDEALVAFAQPAATPTTEQPAPNQGEAA